MLNKAELEELVGAVGNSYLAAAADDTNNGSNLMTNHKAGQNQNDTIMLS